MCWPYHSGSPILGQCQGLRLWWCWTLSRRCSVFLGPGEECSFHAGTIKQSTQSIWLQTSSKILIWHYLCPHIPPVPWLSGQTTPPPVSQVRVPLFAAWDDDTGHHLHRNPSQCRAGSPLPPKTPCMSQCWDVAAETEAAPPALQRAVLAWRRWSNSASW